MSSHIGEVLEASTSEFLAECYELHRPPPLGSLVRTSDGEVAIYGVVSSSATQGIDPGRRPLARGRGVAEEEDIYRQNPQLARLLRTTFSAQIVGHEDKTELRHYLPPRPPRVHGFVYLCDGEEVRRFSQGLDFLTILLGGGGEAGDEVVAACLRRASQAHEDGRAFLVRAGKELALLLSGELKRLNAILRRIRQ